MFVLLNFWNLHFILKFNFLVPLYRNIILNKKKTCAKDEILKQIVHIGDNEMKCRKLCAGNDMCKFYFVDNGEKYCKTYRSCNTFRPGNLPGSTYYKSEGR